MSFDKNQLSIPWIESPFFYSLIDTFDLTEKERELCIQYHEKGYIEIDLGLTDEEINLILDDMYKFIDDKNTVFHAEHYQYTQSKRLFELWKQSEVTAKLCINKKILNILQILYQRNPFPFSTINFFKGSNQPLHSDVMHFHTVPSLWMAGVWVAFEDVDETNGSLKIVPGSHKWCKWEYDELNLSHPDEIKEGEEVNYRIYEEFVRQLIEEKKAESYILKLKKGQALIWSANMLHGGCNIEGITDFSKTRLTQAIHYFFEGCDEYYHPMFSKKYKGQYAKKWCDDTNNIKTYLETGQSGE